MLCLGGMRTYSSIITEGVSFRPFSVSRRALHGLTSKEHAISISYIERVNSQDNVDETLKAAKEDLVSAKKDLCRAMTELAESEQKLNGAMRNRASETQLINLQRHVDTAWKIKYQCIEYVGFCQKELSRCAASIEQSDPYIGIKFLMSTEGKCWNGLPFSPLSDPLMLKRDQIIDMIIPELTASSETGSVLFRGPAACGKTSMLGLICQYLLDNQFVERNGMDILYVPCVGFKGTSIKEFETWILRWATAQGIHVNSFEEMESSLKFLILDDAHEVFHFQDFWNRVLKRTYLFKTVAAVTSSPEFYGLSLGLFEKTVDFGQLRLTKGESNLLIEMWLLHQNNEDLNRHMTSEVRDLFYFITNGHVGLSRIGLNSIGNVFLIAQNKKLEFNVLKHLILYHCHRLCRTKW